MTRLADKIRVEPLDNVTLARVEQRVLATVDLSMVERRRAAWFSSRRWLAPAVAVAGIALAIFLNVRSSLDSNRFAAAVPDTAPAEPTTLITAEDTARLEIDGAVIVLGPNARADLIRQADGGTTVALHDGRVDCEVEPRTNRLPFIVNAGDLDVTVVGTVFAVERHGDDVRVEVTRGKVQVGDRTGGRLVAAGEAWTDSSDQVVALAAPARAAAPEPTPARDPPPAPDPTLAVAPTPTPAPTPTSAVADTRAKPSKRPTRAAKPRASDDTGPVTLTRPPRGTAPPELEHLRALETREPAEAAGKYHTAAYIKRKGSIASYAMYSLAYLQMFELGQADKAIETISHFHRRFRKARESRAAVWLGVRATCKAGTDAECRDAAQSYVSRYPSGRHADQARWLIRR